MSARYVEKPEVTSVVSMGIYALEPEALQYIPDGYFDVPDLVHALLEAGEPVGAYPFDGLWFDIGQRDDYEEAVAAWLASGPGSRRPGAGRSPRSRLSVTLVSRIATNASARTTTDRVWRVPLSDLAVDRELEEAALEAVRSGWWSMGPRVAAFEEAFADFCGVRAAFAVANGTAALHLALLAVEAGPRDEVLVPSLNFVAAANTIVHVGARPVFCDIEATHRPLVDPDDIERADPPGDPRDRRDALRRAPVPDGRRPRHRRAARARGDRGRRPCPWGVMARAEVRSDRPRRVLQLLLEQEPPDG